MSIFAKRIEYGKVLINWNDRCAQSAGALTQGGMPVPKTYRTSLGTATRCRTTNHCDRVVFHFEHDFPADSLDRALIVLRANERVIDCRACAGTMTITVRKPQARCRKGESPAQAERRRYSVANGVVGDRFRAVDRVFSPDNKSARKQRVPRRHRGSKRSTRIVKQ